jgi:D-alanine--poly(phosphoribitol) ligase subunit 2
MNKSARIRACLERAGLPRLPPDDASDLASCGLDSLLAVLTILELQKEFRVTIPAREATPAAFETIESLSFLIQD